MLKNNYFENSAHKSQQPIMSTPCKNDKYELSDDQILNSNRKSDDAFNSYCQNNLSPINFIRNNCIASPLQPNPKSYKNTKNVFSPAISNQFRKFHPMSHNGEYMIPTNPNGPDYIPVQHDFDMDYHQQYHNKSIITPIVNKNAQPIILLNGKPGNMPSTKLSHFANQAMAESSHNYYVYQSPVFKMTFNSKNQFEKYIDSDFNKIYVDDFHLLSWQSKQIVPKSQDQEFENRQIPYKRVIQFHDENEDENLGEGNKNQILDELSQIKNGSSIINLKNKGEGKSINLFEENTTNQQNTLLDSQSTQMTFNPFKNSQNNQASDNATTVKKTTDSQISSQDLIQTAQKQQQQQKRKLFESPQFREERDLQTPSTKKKSSSLLIGNQAPQFSNPTSTKKKEEKLEQKKMSKKEKLIQQNALSTKKEESSHIDDEDLKNPSIEKSTAEKQDEQEDIDEEEDRQEKSSHSSNSLNIPFNAQNSSMKPAIPAEDRKICCNCKRTKCLKLYCECFAASRMCEGCTCQGCFNKPEFESMRKEARQAILERNNSAFDPKIDSQAKLKQLCSEEGTENELKAHSKGCNCKKSNCLKKYCECFQLGVKCTKLCKCDNCRNNVSHSHNSNEEPDSRINATPSASNILASTGKMNASRSQTNQISLSQNDYSQYNQYNYYCQDNYQNYYYNYPYGNYYYYGDYYMQNPDEQGENSAGIHPPYQYGYAEQYGYEHYPHMVHPSQYKENGRTMKKYPHQYQQQMHQYHMQNEGQTPQSVRTKKGQKIGVYDDQQSYDNYGYPYMLHPEKKRKQASQEEANNKIKSEDGKIQESMYEESTFQKETSEQIGSKINISPRLKEASFSEIKEEDQLLKKEYKGSKDQKKEKKEESDQLQTINEEQEDENNQQMIQEEEENIQEQDIQEDIEENQVIAEQENSADNIQEEIDNIEELSQDINKKSTSKAKKAAKKEDKKRKQTKKEILVQTSEITKSPHNTRKNQKENYLKASDEKPKQSNQKSQSKKVTPPQTAKKNEKKEKKGMKSPQVEEFEENNNQSSSTSKRSNSKRQKNTNS